MNNEVLEVLISYGVDGVELNPPFSIPSGNITSVNQGGFTYSHGEGGSYEDLTDIELKKLAEEVEQEIIAEDDFFWCDDYN